MSILNFSEANCKNCYKCLRYCPVKAIKIKNEQAEIVEERCIGCGQCFVVCPQDARKVSSNIENIKEAIKSDKKVIATVAPSVASIYDIEYISKMITGLKKLGFDIVEETAIGADIVSQLYSKYINKTQQKNFITTCCPSVNLLIERYYPNLIKYMLPFVSPMIAHGKVLKHIHGIGSYVVFLGPCVAKKIEANDFQNEGVIDAVLTFEELDELFKKENIIIDFLEPSDFDRQVKNKIRNFPIENGIINNLSIDENIKYESITVSGINECIDFLECLSNNCIHNTIIEMNICSGGCINGPAMPKNDFHQYTKKKKLKNYINKKTNTHEIITKIPEKLNYTKLFFDKSIKNKKADDKEIEKILKMMGKYESSDELNCGACGYNTCREKANAVYEGMAEMNMCLPFMRSKAEGLKDVIFENSPNVIIVVDDEMRIKEFNPTAEKIFNIKADYVKEKPVSILIDDSDFILAKETKSNIYRKKVIYPSYNVVVLQNILYLEKQNVVLIIMIDITMEENNRKELIRVKENTLDAAQRVIEKQMRVAQEIASLLGETTAETKIILTKLKELTLGEAGDNR